MFHCYLHGWSHVERSCPWCSPQGTISTNSLNVGTKMETQATGRRAVNRIVVTGKRGIKISVMVQAIVAYFTDDDGTMLNISGSNFPIKETSEEIDRLIDEAMGAE